jgi:hypothetical protein
VVIAMATEEFATIVLPAIDGPNWGKSGTPSHQMLRPYYVASHLLYNTPGLRTVAQNISNTTPPLERRLVGVNYALAPGHANDLYNSYMSRMANHYRPQAPGDVTVDGTENHYDGAYSLLYAVTVANAWTPPGDWHGEQILAGLSGRVLTTRSGSISVDIGINALGGAVGNLSSNSQYRMSLYGTMGPPTFDPLSGTRDSDTSAWCIERKTTPSLAWNYAPDGLLYVPPEMTGDPDSFVDAPGGVPICLQDYVEEP